MMMCRDDFHQEKDDEATVSCPSMPCAASADQPPSSSIGRTKTDKPKRDKRQQSVKISTPNQNEVYSVEHFHDMSLDERVAVWFTQNEVEETMKECYETVRQMKEGVPLIDDDDGNEFTSRGLEYCTPEGFNITAFRLDVVRLVLEEQDRQKSIGIVDPEMLAAAVGGISNHRSRIAHLAAMKDARGVYGTERQWSTANCDDPTESNSFTNKRESRRGRISRSGSFGTTEERVRRRRGFRAPLGDKAQACN